MKLNFHQKSHFAQRHIGTFNKTWDTMLQTIGADSLEELISQTVPASIRLQRELQLPEALSEHHYLEMLREVAAKNKIFKTYIGQGYYNCIVPSPIKRNIFENPGWYTQYTPYQAEISQGRLEALLNFQTVVSELCGMPIANASLLDEGTAAAEAMIMFFNASAKKARGEAPNRFYVETAIFPQTHDILKARSLPLGIELVPFSGELPEEARGAFGVLVQYPNALGEVGQLETFCQRAQNLGLYVAVATDLLSLTLLTPPGAAGADVAIGNAQRFGVPMGYGGPHAAFFATTDEFKRIIPGRIIGISKDAQGNPAYRMALQTREQHIRREKATSNICTAQALLAIMSGMYAVYHGPEGLKEIALRVHSLTTLLATELSKLGYKPLNSNWFDTLSFATGAELNGKIRILAETKKINLRYEENLVGISLDETTTLEDVKNLIEIFALASGLAVPANEATFSPENYRTPLADSLLRKDSYMEQPVFKKYRTETQLMRYIKQLEKKDLSLVQSMIPLGSCTMKLNAASELYPVSWPEFALLHPFVPVNQAEGYLQVVQELESYLNEITGFAATSLQPNSGAQGEYAGMLVIKAYLNDIGQAHRNIVLIPSSAHGTNPATAVMAGMKVVVVNCDSNGNIDLSDLKEKAALHSEFLAAIMLTYPSTHGVFEETVKEVCSTIHAHGGQVYMDGANMNAQVGLTNPASIGADVCHINLHKTFSIPHGGGGPGMGPICVAAHLAPFLPGHALVKTGGEKAIHAVSAAPFGSASILLISYGYIRMLGKEGVVQATRYAILNANYLKSRLEGSYKVLYTGKQGRVAHELILDCRTFKQSAGIEVEDIAKRLMDYGFHAPTVSFPVPGTLMIEPTESEDLAELDRFAEAMLQIREEIREIEAGLADSKINVLKNAPHTVELLAEESWPYSYSREKAVYPLDWVPALKFWPPVARVDNAYGDKNLVCTCPSPDAYIEEPAPVPQES